MTTWFLLLALIPAQLDRLEGLVRAGDYERALPELEEYVRTDPSSTQALYQLGYVYYRTHKLSDAVKVLSQCLSRDPRHADAHRILGFVLTALHRLDLAEREFTRAVELKPDSAESHYALGRLYYERGSYSDAAASFRRAVAILPSYMKAHQSLGLASEALNEIEVAQRHLTRAVELNDADRERSEWPYVNLAGFYNRRGRHREALVYAGKAVDLAPHSDAAHFQRAKARCGLQQWSECAGGSRRRDSHRPQEPRVFLPPLHSPEKSRKCGAGDGEPCGIQPPEDLGGDRDLPAARG